MMNRRKDAFLSAARMGQEIYAIAQKNGGVCTIGSCTTRPGHRDERGRGVPDHAFDMRHLDAAALGRMLDDAKAAAGRFRLRGRRPPRRGSASGASTPCASTRRSSDFCEGSIRETCGEAHTGSPRARSTTLPRVARARGADRDDTFVQSLLGISHNKLEDTREEHLELCVHAFDRLASKVLDRVMAAR